MYIGFKKINKMCLGLEALEFKRIFKKFDQCMFLQYQLLGRNNIIKGTVSEISTPTYEKMTMYDLQWYSFF